MSSKSSPPAPATHPGKTRFHGQPGLRKRGLSGSLRGWRRRPGAPRVPLAAGRRCLISVITPTRHPESARCETTKLVSGVAPPRPPPLPLPSTKAPV